MYFNNFQVILVLWDWISPSFSGHTNVFIPRYTPAKYPRRGLEWMILLSVTLRCTMAWISVPLRALNSTLPPVTSKCAQDATLRENKSGGLRYLTTNLMYGYLCLCWSGVCLETTLLLPESTVTQETGTRKGLVIGILLSGSSWCS